MEESEGQTAEPKQLRQAEDATSINKQQRSGVRIHISWRKGVNAPSWMSCRYNAVANDTAMYVRYHRLVYYAYNASTSTWSQLPHSPTSSCLSVIISNLLTLIGGSYPANNQLFSLTEITVDIHAHALLQQHTTYPLHNNMFW